MKNLKSLILSVIALALAASCAHAQTGFTGIVLVDRDSEGATPLSSWDPLGHTVVVYVENDVVVSTASWGSDEGVEAWWLDRAKDLGAAQQALAEGNYRRGTAGGGYALFVAVYYQKVAQAANPHQGIISKGKIEADAFWYSYSVLVGATNAPESVVNDLWEHERFYYPTGDLSNFLKEQHVRFLASGVSPEAAESVLLAYFARLQRIQWESQNQY